jgi:hypothetical protein
MDLGALFLKTVQLKWEGKKRRELPQLALSRTNGYDFEKRKNHIGERR